MDAGYKFCFEFFINFCVWFYCFFFFFFFFFFFLLFTKQLRYMGTKYKFCFGFPFEIGVFCYPIFFLSLIFVSKRGEHTTLPLADKLGNELWSPFPSSPPSYHITRDPNFQQLTFSTPTRAQREEKCAGYWTESFIKEKRRRKKRRWKCWWSWGSEVMNK